MIAANSCFLRWACLVPVWCLPLLPPPSVVAQEKSVLGPDFNKDYVEAVGIKDRAKGIESEYNEIYRYRDGVVACLSLEEGMDIADVGAGTGFFSRLFAKKVGPSGKVYATDIARPFVKYIDETAHRENLSNINALVNTERSTKLPPESVDIVFTSEAYHHFAYPKDMLASIRQALRSGGALVIIDKMRYLRGDDEPDTHVRCGKGTVKDEAREAGFDFVSEIPLFATHYYLKFTKRRKRPPSLTRFQYARPTWDMLGASVSPLFGVILRKAPPPDYSVPRPPGRMSGRNGERDFQRILELAYGVSIARIKIADSVAVPEGKFQLFVNVPETHQALRLPLMRQAVEATFDLQSHVKSELTDVYILAAPDGPGKKLQPVAPGADLRKMEIPDILVPTRADLADDCDDDSDKQRSYVTRLVSVATVADMARNIEGILGKPIINESALSGRFNGYMAWYIADPKNGTADAKSFIWYARRHLGLVLTAAKREVEFTIVEPRVGPRIPSRSNP